jgi:galactose oxidase
MAVPRCYHSIALLLPDATVISGGGGLCAGCSQNHFDAQIFTPPYLFAADGTPATRPVIVSVSETTVAVGGSLTVATGGAIGSMALIRTGSATHTVDTDQRRIALDYTTVGTNSYSFTVPNDPGKALPGIWMLFVLDANGVPSLAEFIQITL